METRFINWMQHSALSLGGRVPELKKSPGAAEYVVERLSCLFLERISPEASLKLFRLLPPDAAPASLKNIAGSDSTPSIGYPDFVERAAHALGLSRLDSTTDLPSQAADAFLWAVAQDLPPDLKEILARELPTELKARMNLGTMHSEEAKVA